jgi:hypothetical protein
MRSFPSTRQVWDRAGICAEAIVVALVVICDFVRASGCPVDAEGIEAIEVAPRSSRRLLL